MSERWTRSAIVATHAHSTRSEAGRVTLRGRGRRSFMRAWGPHRDYRPHVQRGSHGRRGWKTNAGVRVTTNLGAETAEDAGKKTRGAAHGLHGQPISAISAISARDLGSLREVVVIRSPGKQTRWTESIVLGWPSVPS